MKNIGGFMALTSSQNLPLGMQAPAFNLLDPKTQKMCSLAELKSNKATVILFISNHCPYVQHIRSSLIQLAADYQAKGVAFIAINANDVKNYPADSPKKMCEQDLPFPYLYDETQEIAKAYQAACTPDIYIFSGDLTCVYHGQFDSSRPGNNIPATGSDLSAALDAILAGKSVSATQTPSVGCNIKWRP
jgi:thiol-disulfide isomerase/thioredoxin